MKAKDLTPGMEVATGGVNASYGRQFAIVVAVGRWAYTRDGWAEVAYAAPSALLLRAVMYGVTEDETRARFAASTPEQLIYKGSGLAVETLPNVRSTWADHEAERAVRAEARKAKAEADAIRDARHHLLADRLAEKLGTDGVTIKPYGAVISWAELERLLG